MKKLSKAEAEQMQTASRGRTTTVSAMAATLLPGEALIVSRDDWKTNDAPYRVVNYLAKKTGRVFEKGRLPDGSGWLIKRLQ